MHKDLKTSFIIYSIVCLLLLMTTVNESKEKIIWKNFFIECRATEEWFKHLYRLV